MTAGLVLLAGGAAAGLFGSLLGLGGGVLIVPLLTLGFGLPVREAVAVSLVSVIVTSSASAGVYLQRHVANLRLGMVLELFTASGALVGGLVAFMLPDRALAGLFAVLLGWVAATMLRRRDPAPRAVTPAASGSGPVAGDPVEDEGELGAVALMADLVAAPGAVGSPAEAVPAPRGSPVPGPAAAEPAAATLADRLSGPDYRVQRLPVGMAGSVAAGLVSALLGVGGGIIKVPVMHLVLGVPLKVATATSNMMIGVTATSSAVIYLLRGGIDAYVAGPTALGVFVGASLGSRVAHRIDVRILRWLFVAVLLYTGYQMALRALGL